MYTITGVTGHVGSVAAQTLLAQGKQVRVLVRDAAKGEPWANQGAEVAVGTFHDHAALVKAFTGVEGAFVLIPPAESMGEADPIAYNAQIAEKIAAAVRESGLKHLVLLSSVGAQHADGTGPIKALNRAEKILAGPHLTAVRPAYFQENWATSLGALDQKIMPSFVDKTVRYAQVATADIGRTIAAALVEGTRGVIELAGPRDYTGDEVAAMLSVAAVDVPKDQQVGALTSHGVPEPAAKLFVEMYRGIENGTVGFEGTPRRGKIEVSATLSKLLGK